jgi:undecaprenyl-diphosphatase
MSLLFGALITNVTLKNLVARTRPFYTIPELQTLVPYPKDYSFPSGHATSSFAGGTSLFIMLKKRYSFLFLVFAILMGFSRLYVGVHYPTDVIVGLIVGTVSAVVSFYLVKWLYVKRSKDNLQTA